MSEINNSELEQRLSEMCFYEQPIFLVDPAKDEQDDIIGYELLLRKTGGENRFPAMLFKEYMRDNEANNIFCGWLVKSVEKIVKDNPGKQYSFNLDPQQLLYETTFEQLQKLAPYGDSVMIEITEGVPSKRDFNQYFNYSVHEQIKKIREMGFGVAIDDVSSGMNSFNAVRDYVEDINRLKLSLIQLRNVEEELVMATIVLWKTLATKNKMELVIEGIDDLKISEWLLENELPMQQGYYFATPRELA